MHVTADPTRIAAALAALDRLAPLVEALPTTKAADAYALLAEATEALTDFAPVLV